jgi:hypothetical protein
MRSYIPRASLYIQEEEKKWIRGGISVAGNKRYETAQLICNHMLRQNIARVHGTAREIASSLEVQGTCSSSISALLMFIQRNHIRKSRYGFFISETQAFKKSGYPHRYTIELMDGPAVSPVHSQFM